MNFTTTVIGIGTLFFAITCWAIIDIAKKDFGGIEKKAIWGIVALIPFIGPVVYFAVGFRKGKKSPSRSAL